MEYQDKRSGAIDVRFAVIDVPDFSKRLGNELPKDAGVSISIWTTTPWTLPGNQAVALNAVLNYSLVETNLGGGPEYLLVATEMSERLGITVSAVDSAESCVADSDIVITITIDIYVVN